MSTPPQNFVFPTEEVRKQAMELVADMMKSGKLPPVLPDNISFSVDPKNATIEHRVDIAQISAEISEKLTEWDPLFVKVTRVVDERTLEIRSCDHPVDLDEFWADVPDDVILSSEQKERLYLQYHRSSGSHAKVLAFVSALQVLCDSGISFHHDYRSVVDIWISSTSEFDISDILGTRILKTIDPVHDIGAIVVNNHERMETLRTLHRKEYRKLGMEAQYSRHSVDYIKRHRPTAYRGSMPHWWVTVITEGPMLSGIVQRSMVHIDICAAAFDDAGFHTHNGKLVSLQVFTTPEYLLLKNKSSKQTLQTGILGPRKFIMDSGTRSTGTGWNNVMHCPQPYSMRHFRCFIRQDGTCEANAPTIEVTSLDTFFARSTRFMPGNMAHWYRIIAELRHKLILDLPPATKVVIRDLKKRPELNGRSAQIFDADNTAVSPDRVAVSVESENIALSLRTISICFTQRTQYKCHTQILEEVEKMDPTSKKATSKAKKPTKKEEEACYKALRKDPNLTKAFNMFQSDNISIATFSNPLLAEGMRKLTKPPFDRIISTEGIEYLNQGLMVAEHPRFAEAFKLIKLMDHAKQRVMETNPNLIAGDGSVLIGDGSDFECLVREITKKIKYDKGLTQVFELLDDKNLFPNPVEQWGPYSL